MNRAAAIIAAGMVSASGMHAAPASTLHVLPSVQRPVTVNFVADSEHARLTGMIGVWDIEMTLWPRPGGASITAKGTSAIRSLFDGLFIEEKIDGAVGGSSFTTLAWTGYNTDTHQYEATRISSTNPSRIAEAGSWNAQSKQFELKATYQLMGQSWTQRTVIQQSSADAMIATSYMSFGAVPEWKGVEIKYVRKSK